MDKPKLNKSELTRLRRQLKMFDQFLPVLKLKKERLQAEHLRLKREVASASRALEARKKASKGIAALLCEPLPVDLSALARATEVRIAERIIAGVYVPVLEHVGFADVDLPRFGLPAWVTRALPMLRDLVRAHKALEVLTEQAARIGHELRKATQKVNLFEKVLIPDTEDVIRRIEIALGDQQVAAVCRGKLAKTKQLRAAEAEGVGA